MSKKIKIKYPQSWDEDTKALEDELEYMEALKTKSREFNEKFWKKFDELNTCDNESVSTSEFYEEAFLFAKEGESI